MLDIDKATSNKVLINFNIPKEFYQAYKIASQTTNKTMTTILYESFLIWCREQGIMGEPIVMEQHV